ncbi:hypothetical protein ABW19_dt0203637 [Dactylella cylindrospora]|nr:hypothetical protein ABW19_dt0203637 [Dactylella cylindrospora]
MAQSWLSNAFVRRVSERPERIRRRKLLVAGSRLRESPFELPQELVDEILQYLSGNDIMTLSLVSSATRRAISPTLYRSMIVYFGYFQHRTSVRVSARRVVFLMKTADETLQYVRTIKMLPEKKRGAYSGYGTEDPGEPVDVFIRKLLRRFQPGQLSEIYLDRIGTSPETITLILQSQPNLLKLGLFKLVRPENMSGLLGSGCVQPLRRLLSLRIKNIDQDALPIILLVLAGSCHGLRSLELGHNLAPMLNEISMDPRFNPRLGVSFSSLAQLHLHRVPDLSFAASRLLSNPSFNLKGLRTLRIDKCLNVNHILTTLCGNMPNLRSLQIVDCTSTASAIVQFLNRLDRLETLQLAVETREVMSLDSIFRHRAILKRLWLELSVAANRHTPVYEFVEKLQTSTSSSEQWPKLEELAIGSLHYELKDIVLRDLSLIRSLRFLRIIDGLHTNAMPLLHQRNVENYLRRMLTQSILEFGEPPNIEMVVVGARLTERDWLGHNTLKPKVFWYRIGFNRPWSKRWVFSVDSCDASFKSLPGRIPKSCIFENIRSREVWREDGI